MALEKFKVEMKGDTSRWTRRADAKHSADRRRRAEDRELESGWYCTHRRMRYCCPKPCGHLICDCGLAWDEGAEK